MRCAWCLDGAEVSLRQFDTSVEVSQHFWKGLKCPTDTSALVPNCLGSEMCPKCLYTVLAVFHGVFS